MFGRTSRAKKNCAVQRGNVLSVTLPIFISSVASAAAAAAVAAAISAVGADRVEI